MGLFRRFRLARRWCEYCCDRCLVNDDGGAPFSSPMVVEMMMSRLASSDVITETSLLNLRKG